MECLRGRPVERPGIAFYTSLQASSDLASAAPTADESAASDIQRGLALLRLVPPQEDAAATQSTIDDRVGGFFASEGRVVMMHLDRNLPIDHPIYAVTLLHELVHAAQEQEGRLRAEAATLDAELSQVALLEGEATWFQDLAITRALRTDPGLGGWRRTFDAYRDRAWLAARRTPYGFRFRALDFPYAYGGAAMQRAWEVAEQAGIDQVFADPPRSTQALMSSAGQDLAGAAALDGVGSPPLGSDWERLASLHLGLWNFWYFLDGLALELPLRDAAELAPVDLGWVGDVLTLWRGPAEAGAAEPPVVASWRIRLASDSAAAALLQRIGSASGDTRAWQRDTDVMLFASSSPGAVPVPLGDTGWSAVPADDRVTGTETAATAPVARVMCPMVERAW